MVGAEFIGMILLIVYVGAVAVLFLFVVMMLNVAQQKQSWFIGKKATHIPSGLLVGLLIFLELLVVVGGWQYKDNLMSSSTLIINEQISNTHQLEMYYTLNTFIFSTFRNNFIISDDRRDYFDF